MNEAGQQGDTAMACDDEPNRTEEPKDGEAETRRDGKGRRSRKTLSCERCRFRKIKCDRVSGLLAAP